MISKIDAFGNHLDHNIWFILVHIGSCLVCGVRFPWQPGRISQSVSRTGPANVEMARASSRINSFTAARRVNSVASRYPPG